MEQNTITQKRITQFVVNFSETISTEKEFVEVFNNLELCYGKSNRRITMDLGIIEKQINVVEEIINLSQDDIYININKIKNKFVYLSKLYWEKVTFDLLAIEKAKREIILSEETTDLFNSYSNNNEFMYNDSFEIIRMLIAIQDTINHYHSVFIEGYKVEVPVLTKKEYEL